jgi:hypothetical protein
LWLADGFAVKDEVINDVYIEDFNNRMYISGCVLICRETSGGFNKEYIDTLPFDEYLELNKICAKLQERATEDNPE